MNPYFISYLSNYGSGAMVVNAATDQDARELAIKNGAWEDTLTLCKIDLTTHGVVAEVIPSGG